MKYQKENLEGQIKGFSQKHGLTIQVEKWDDRIVYKLMKEYTLGKSEQAVQVQLPNVVDENTVPVIFFYDDNLSGLELPKRMALFYDGKIEHILMYPKEPSRAILDTKKLTISPSDIQ